MRFSRLRTPLPCNKHDGMRRRRRKRKHKKMGPPTIQMVPSLRMKILKRAQMTSRNRKMRACSFLGKKIHLKQKIHGQKFYLSSNSKICFPKCPLIFLVSSQSTSHLPFNFTQFQTAFTDSSGNHPTKLVVGLVGYPNVGKSSTINSLLGEKKVSVSSTPGKTKHFQTIHLSPTMILCDCPGLVFPQFATTKADLVCDGVLPIDQMREFTGPTSLITKRFPQKVLEATYGLSIKIKTLEEGGDGKVTAENFLIAYAGEL